MLRTRIQNQIQNQILKTDIFEERNNNVSVIDEPVAGDGEEEDNSAGRYYISVMNNNNGDTAYQRYMVNEDDGTYCLITEMELLQNNTGGSLQKMGRRKLVEKVKVRLPKTASERSVVMVTFGEQSDPVQDALGRAFRDLDEIRFRGFTKEEEELYRNLSEKEARNMRSAL